MTVEILNLEKQVDAVSKFQFQDASRQERHNKLSIELMSIVENNTIAAIWDNAVLIVRVTQLLEAIMDLIEAERIETVWDRERCIEWAEEAGIENAESYVDNKFEIFDDHIEIEGDLLLIDSKTRELPVGLTTVGGDLDLYNSEVRELPAGLTTVGGTLDLYNSQIKVLPAGLTSIGGRLYLGKSQVQELPAGLTSIGGDVNLKDSQVRELPAGLTTIGGNLWLRGSQITDIPDNLVIQFDVWAKGCPQSLIDKLSKMKEKGNIKGRVITT
ncbi:hypothetical protein COT97_01725 [Candidatus Falkowbacteria bacterium CG10_big_fil_rev_8_21_14_0_10_39_11]|uniref:Leucine-rich repeat domain-containing protein n=1 Tax=Candidatus Falkowbacteria bacterium CG10_big_fil_rev_8_21_14_0_10_39_11 TaxID=1974565 RepID=A0A2H0V5R3_9BACT|nr:MAG: hypothetical protein COT97_01725 [Candidatus Falkowbacteria bacterium CG10_big_fil_rev_8_21_14_0_10_39_11]